MGNSRPIAVAGTQRRMHAMLNLLGEPLIWAMFADGALLNPARFGLLPLFLMAFLNVTFDTCLLYVSLVCPESLFGT